MSIDLICNFYDYHFTINRKIWDECITKLTDDQFLEEVDYGIGSIRNHVVHMMSVDKAWFSDLRGEAFEGHMKPEDYPTRELIRTTWDEVEREIREVLATLENDILTKPFPESKGQFNHGQMLLHVANHGTDHRAQLLRLINDQGIETFGQDYIYFALGRM